MSLLTRAARISRPLLVVAMLALAGGSGLESSSADATDDTDETFAMPAVPSIAAAEPDPEPSEPRTFTPPELPVPEPPPLDPRAPTPEIRHGLLEIPSIGLSQPFFEGVTLTAIDRGPSHWPGTAMPGQLGNVVIAGHRTTKTRPFWDLDLVQPGDELIFTMTSGDRYVYVLDRTEIVDGSDVSIITQSYGYTATLFACHPKGSAAQRIVGRFRLQSTELAQAAA